jgi:hypothetical protein
MLRLSKPTAIPAWIPPGVVNAHTPTGMPGCMNTTQDVRRMLRNREVLIRRRKSLIWNCHGRQDGRLRLRTAAYRPVEITKSVIGPRDFSPFSTMWE